VHEFSVLEKTGQKRVVEKVVKKVREKLREQNRETYTYYYAGSGP
jgi:hypothetical protein